METTLAKWGNSQGLRIPREACAHLGVSIGSKAHIEFDMANTALIIRFEQQPEKKYRRTRKLTMRELAGDWTGEKIGEEWGGEDVGEEVVE